MTLWGRHVYSTFISQSESMVNLLVKKCTASYYINTHRSISIHAPNEKNCQQGQRLLECNYGSRYHDEVFLEILSIITLEHHLVFVTMCKFLL